MTETAVLAPVVDGITPHEQGVITPESLQPEAYAALLHRYTGQPGRFANDPNYVPSVAEAKELGLLAAAATSSKRLTVRDWDRPPVMEYVGPDDQAVDPVVVTRLKWLSNPLTWLQERAEERLFDRAGTALAQLLEREQASSKLARGLVKSRNAQREQGGEFEKLLQSAAYAAQNVMSDTDTLSVEKFRRLAELSRVGRRHLQEYGIDPEAVLHSRRARAVVQPVVWRTGRAAPPESSQGKPESLPESEAALLEIMLGDQRFTSADKATIASLLYYQKMTKASPTLYPSLQIARAKRGMAVLTPAERERVSTFADQLAIIEAMTAALPQTGVPSEAVLAERLFPGSGRELTPEQQSAVQTARARLQYAADRLAPKMDPRELPDSRQSLRRAGWEARAARLRELIEPVPQLVRQVGAAAMTLAMIIGIATTSKERVTPQAMPTRPVAVAGRAPTSQPPRIAWRR